MITVELTQVGDKFTINPSFVNEGPYVAHNATIDFTIPADLTLESSDVNGVGIYDAVNDIWSLGDVAAPTGSDPVTREILLTFVLDSDMNLPLQITATVSSNCADNLSDNTEIWEINTIIV